MDLWTFGIIDSVITCPAEPDREPEREFDRTVLVYEIGLSFMFRAGILMGDSDGLGPNKYIEKCVYIRVANLRQG